MDTRNIKLKSLFDTVHTIFHSIQAAVDTRLPFFDRSQPNLDVVYVVSQSVDLGIDLSQKGNDKIVRFNLHPPYSAATRVTPWT